MGRKKKRHLHLIDKRSAWSGSRPGSLHNSVILGVLRTHQTIQKKIQETEGGKIHSVGKEKGIQGQSDREDEIL